MAAAERVHTVAAGESAASLAKRFYGDRNLGDLLLRYNGRLEKMIHPGERLNDPLLRGLSSADLGDTWSGLAKRHLGRASASPVLAELNGYAAGEPLRMWHSRRHPGGAAAHLARGETLSSLADRFYGDRAKGRRTAGVQPDRGRESGWPWERRSRYLWLPSCAAKRTRENDAVEKAAVASPSASEARRAQAR